MTKAGQNVFPFPGADADRYDSEFGMDLREHYAGLAMAGMLAYSHVSPMHGNATENAKPEDVARKAFDYAQAMVNESKRRTEEDRANGAAKVDPLRAAIENHRRRVEATVEPLSGVYYSLDLELWKSIE